jgi:predicted RNA binding protein YcfA (HicA-like mRNA interferase family)
VRLADFASVSRPNLERNSAQSIAPCNLIVLGVCVNICASGAAHAATNTRKIIARLLREGWRNIGGGQHDVFKHPDKPNRVVVPRHREQKPGTARSIAKAAGWIGRKE